MECHCHSRVPQEAALGLLGGGGWASLVGLLVVALVLTGATSFLPSCQVDFTSCTGLFCVLGIVMMVTGIVSAIVLSFKYVSVPES